MPSWPCGVMCRSCEVRLPKPSRHVAVALWLMRVSRRVPSELMGDLIEEVINGRSASWLYAQATYAVVVGTSQRRISMNSYIHSTASATGRILVSVAAFWLLSFAGVQIAERWLGGWPATEIGQLVAAAVAAVIAFRFRAAVAAYLVLGFAAFVTAELVVHLIYGIGAAQGAPTHFAVMGAGVIGVALGAIVATMIPRAQRGGASAHTQTRGSAIWRRADARKAHAELARMKSHSLSTEG